MAQIFLCCFFLWGIQQALGKNTSWDTVSGIDKLQASEFQAYVLPIVEIAANAYRHPNLKRIEGWRFIESLVPRSGAGARAVLYKEDTSSRMILGFRGTDLESEADMCADTFLFDSFVPGMDAPSPEACSKYSSEDLDYYSQAVKYTATVLGKYADAPLLLTGHSLGAALAVLVSARLSDRVILPAVVFGSPSTRSLITNRSLELLAEERHLVFSIGDEWDLITRSGLSGQVGVLCAYRHKEPRECIKCEESVDVNIQQSVVVNMVWPCFVCFMKTHLMKHVLELVYSGAKPSCQAT